MAALKAGIAPDSAAASLKSLKDNGVAFQGAQETGTQGPDYNQIALNPTQQTAIADTDATITLAEQAKQTAQGIKTGPVAGRFGQLKTALPGGGDQNFNTLNAQLNALKANFMKAISGAAVSEQEAQRLAQFLPSVNDQEAVIQTKLDQLVNELGVKRDSLITAVGGDPSKLQRTPSQPSGVESPAGSVLNEDQTEQTGEKQGFLSRMIEDVSEAFKNRTGRNAEILTSNDSPQSMLLQTTGQNLGFFGDVAGSAIVNTLSAVTPDFIEKPAGEKISELIASGMNSDVAKQTIAAWEDFKSQNPEAARNIEALGDIASFAAIGYGAGRGASAVKEGSGTIAKKTGSALEKSGEAGIVAERASFAQDLVSPVQDKKTRIAQVGRTKEVGVGPFKRSVVEPTAAERRAAEEVAAINGVSPSNTIQQNFNIIQDEVSRQADELVTALTNRDFIVPKREVVSRLDEAAKGLSESPLIVGDAEKMAQRLLEGAKRFINENKGTGTGVLNARKQYDAWVLKQKPKVFDAQSDSAFTVANREVRRVMNDLLEEKAPDVGVKESFRRQSALLQAMDNIAPKAADEAKTAVGRAVQGLAEKVGAKNKIVQAILATGVVGGGGAIAAFLPSVAATGAVGLGAYAGIKKLLSPEVRKGLGRLLKTSGNKLSPEDRNVLEELAD